MDKAALLKQYELETLSGADLSKVNLCGANLHGADLFRADFHEAILSWADLVGTNLSLSDLSRANLSESNLCGANLHGADLFRADFREANLLGVLGLASMKEEMSMLVLLREAIRQESFEFDMSYWHGEESSNKSSFESFLDTCGTIHCAGGFCQVKLAKEGNPLALISAGVAGSYAIPSMAWLFSASKEEFIVYLDKLISGECPLLQR